MNLLELLLVLIIVAVLSTASVVTYQSVYQSHQRRLLLNRVQTALRFARAMAFAEQTSILVCGGDSAGCQHNFDLGFRVQRFDNGKLLRIFSAMARSWHWQFISNRSKQAGLIFAADGTTKGQQGHFQLLDNKRQLAAKIIITHSGRIRLQD